MRSRDRAAAAVFALACSGGDEPPPAADLESQLPLVRLDLREVWLEVEDFPRVDWAGTLDVVAEDAEFTLSLFDVARFGFLRVDVYTPTGADLAAWDGEPGLVSMAADPLTGELSFAIARSVAADDLLYLYEPIRAGRLSEDAFGPGAVAAAREIGVEAIGEWVVRTRTAWLRTDSGDVELLPGHPQEVIVGGNTFRATLVASYAVEPLFAGAPPCGEPPERIAYELVRVEPGAADLEPLVRNPLIPAPLPSCVW